ncbi:hypothetical protein CFP65_0911 [Kitasatospora sp. MMS16-BH015]|uniref:hypothetical protein n=1 Tax=Kitasatospora sp. MMS16-BH015 TaxID=2018025 RepID=UPI000CA12F37|nr:hypothetical protein [Kitasatospora sp. MMS16-BH015]AUG75832.1 hypothetical protein CFP65_0911 [Kitasatospora sp. MMS16-BH015]
MLRIQRARLLVITLSSAIALAAPAPAGAEDTEPAVVPNGTLSSPTVPDPGWGSTPDGWSGGGGLASVSRANHPQGFQALTLSDPATTQPFSTRIRGVRAGATVTLSWDDNPDRCAAGIANRTYSVTVAGTANQPGKFATNPNIGKANWYLGRTYSFTAAEDAPQISFTSTVTTDTQCKPMVTNVAAKQTAPPPSPPKQNDPCAGDAASGPACKNAAGGQAKIDNCPATDRNCLASVAGDGKAEKTGIANETQAVADFGKIPRDQDPNTAAAGLCALPDALVADVQPGESPVPPHQWWYC